MGQASVPVLVQGLVLELVLVSVLVSVPEWVLVSVQELDQGLVLEWERV